MNVRITGPDFHTIVVLNVTEIRSVEHYRNWRDSLELQLLSGEVQVFENVHSIEVIL